MEFELRHPYQEHLHSFHRILNPDVINKKINSTGIFSNDQGRFWCGFSSKLADLEKKGRKGAMERFDHVDNHFVRFHGLVQQSTQEWASRDGQMTKKDGVRLTETQEADDQSGHSQIYWKRN